MNGQAPMMFRRAGIGRHRAEALLHAADVDITMPALLAHASIDGDPSDPYPDAVMVVTPTVFARFDGRLKPELEAGVYTLPIEATERIVGSVRPEQSLAFATLVRGEMARYLVTELPHVVIAPAQVAT